MNKEMNISSYLNEFCLDPISEYSNIITENYYEEGLKFFNDTILEASSGTTKSNIFMKLWNIILKLLRWIKGRLSKFWNWLNSLFKRKDVKTTDQILDDMGINPSSKSSNTPSNINNKKDENKSSENDFINKISNIKDVNKDFIIKFNKANDITLKFYNTDRMMTFNKNKPEIYTNEKNNPRQVNSYGATYLGGLSVSISFIEQPDVFKKFSNIIVEFLSNLDKKLFGNNNEIDYLGIEDEINDIYRTFQDHFKTDKEHSISLDKIMSFNKEINNLLEPFEKINNKIDQIINVKDKEIISILNTISEKLLLIQFGLNTLTGAIAKPFISDVKYHNSISDINELDNFIKESIKAGIPSKYIGYNIIKVSDEKIKGTNIDEEHLTWGQSRLVLFPNNVDFVYKCAVNKIGVLSNRNESNVFNKLSEKYPEINESLAEVKGLSQNGCICIMQKLIKKQFDSSYANTIKKEINYQLHRNNININIDDIHRDNIAYDPKDNYVKCIDYGDFNFALS